MLRTLCALSLFCQTAGAQTEPPRLEILHELVMTDGASHALAYSHDGKRIASGGEHGDLRIFDADTGTLVREIEVSDRWIGAVQFSPDGRRIAVIAGRLSLWDLESGQALGHAHSASERALAWSPDGRWIASSPSTSSVALLDADTLAERTSFDVSDRTSAECIAFSPDGKQIAVGKRSRRAYRFEVAASGKAVPPIDHGERVIGVGFGTDSQLLRAGMAGSHTLWDGETVLMTGRTFMMKTQRDGSRCALQTESSVVICGEDGQRVAVSGSGSIALHPDGKRWARALPGKIEIFEGDRRLHSFPARHSRKPGRAFVTGDGRFVVTAGLAERSFLDRPKRPAAPRLFSIDSGQWLDLPIDRSEHEFEVIEYHGRPEIALLADDRLEIWAVGSKGGAHRVRLHELPPRSRPSRSPRRQLEISTDGRALLSPDKIIDLRSSPLESHAPNRGRLRKLKPFRNRERIIAIGWASRQALGAPGYLALLDHHAATICEVASKQVPHDVDVTPNGKWVVTCSPTGGVHVRDAASLELQGNRAMRWRFVRCLDDEWMLGAGNDLELCRIATAELGAGLALKDTPIALSVSEDGNTAALSLEDRVVVVRVTR